jgi:hypothetical protein
VKQHITPEQLKELTPEQAEKLRELCGRTHAYLSLLSIGQMIDLLSKHSKWIALGFNPIGRFWHIYIDEKGNGPNADELADALWQAVKEVL